MLTVYVTGATGFIGRAVCARMLESGWRVRGVCRKGTSADILPAGVEVLFSDSIQDCNFCDEDFAGVDTVIHLAGRAHILNDSGYNSLEVFRKINVLGTQRLARMAAKTGVRRFIFVSSVKVNGEGVLRPYTENAYGISKREAEDSLVATDKSTIVKETLELLDNRLLYEKMSKAVTPYGDEKAAQRIVEVLVNLS